MSALPQVLLERLTGVDLVLHAGDLDDPAILQQLRQIAPVVAVRGNWHFLSPWPNDQSLPLYHDFEVGGWRIVLSHGHLSPWANIWDKHLMFFPDHQDRANHKIMRRLLNAFPGADIYVFGHSHKALIERRDGMLFVNPGSVYASKNHVPSMALLHLTACGFEAEIVVI
jgi:putative phosphoesterase